MCLKVLFLFVFVFLSSVSPQGSGSGTDGKLRLCVVEGRGSYKRASKYCPVLDQSDSGVECVIGQDRLDCLRRMSKGVVDFGVFSPEDLIATQWANINVLVTDEIRLRPRKFASSIVAVIHKSLLPGLDTVSSVHSILKGSRMCHIGLGADERRPLSETLTEYLESLVTRKSCNSDLSVAENRIKGMADMFGNSCRAGPWVLDAKRDAELKAKFPSLCASCDRPRKCDRHDRYWGPSGALSCLIEGAGNFTWAEADFVAGYFGSRTGFANPGDFAYLCRDGSWQEIHEHDEPCVWLRRPWALLVAKTKAAEEVSRLAANLTSAGVVVGGGWRGALTALLEANGALPAPLRPPSTPLDYLAGAGGFREAYSQAGCTPSRHIVMCTTSILEQNKCEWLSEAASVYGVEPAVQCSRKGDRAACMAAVKNGTCDVTVASGDWLVRAERDMSLIPILHETTPIINQTTTVVAYVREDANIFKMADLKGTRAAFPRFDGLTWHSVLRYLVNIEKNTCKDILNGFFKSICAPGVDEYVTDSKRWIEGCVVEGGKVVEGEWGALRSLVEGKSDVAFLSMATYNQYVAKQIPEPWVKDVKIKPICAEDNEKYCFISWSNIGHVFAKNTTAMRRQEIINVMTKLDQLFGKHNPNQASAVMFSLYGPYNHQNNILFHDNTKALSTSDVLRTHPFDKVPLNFERSLKDIDSCHMSDLTGGAGSVVPKIVLIASMVSVFFV
ncbi:transferrin [Cydia strobilella]|uniref:transferrin n=1 Tax=Cydia strobilella TaxID=1100964 RepID=UPI003007B6C3